MKYLMHCPGRKIISITSHALITVQFLLDISPPMLLISKLVVLIVLQ